MKLETTQKCLKKDGSNDNVMSVDDNVNEDNCERLKSMRTICSEVSKYLFRDSAEGDLYKLLAFQLERKVWQCATILEGNTLLGKLSAGVMIAKDAMYHSKCLLALYKRSKQKSFVLDDNKNGFEKQGHGQVLAELTFYMEQTANEVEGYIFKLSNLANLYKTRVRELGSHTPNRVHTTKLKQ